VGATAVEFAITLVVFALMLVAIAEGGLVMWTQAALQHGVEMAARCASINKTLCASPADIQSYASQESYGLNPPSSVFSVTTLSCGNLVSASYTHKFLTSYFGMSSITLSAKSCFPANI
jgi:Flp pilus assembly protein TadG